MRRNLSGLPPRLGPLKRRRLPPRMADPGGTRDRGPGVACGRVRNSAPGPYRV